MEVAITSECSGQLWNICVWDPLRGTMLRTFKGGVSCSKSLCVIGSDYVISSFKEKPILQVWALNRQDQITSKMIMPGVIKVLTVSPCCNYCVGAINEQVYVWQLSTGALLATVKRHYQDVTNIQFTGDSSWFITTGQEGLVLLWSLETVLSSTESEPEITWSDHSLPVTGLYITKSLVQPIAFTTSLDQTCKLRDINSGRTLLSIQFSEAVHSVAVDHAEETCYVGGQSGNIYRTGLTDPPRSLELSVNETDINCKLVGHEKAVTCLSVSTDGFHLLSGSDDGNVRVWDLASGQCVKVLSHRGPITNAFFAPRYKHLESDKFQPRLSIGVFEKKRQVATDSVGGGGGAPFVAQVLTRCLPISRQDDDRGLNSNQKKEWAQLAEEVAQNELSSLKLVNRELYKYAVEKILSQSQLESRQDNIQKRHK